MMHITIAECTDDGTVVPICDQFVENKYVTIANLKTDKRHLRHEKIITTEIKGVLKGPFTSELLRGSDIGHLPDAQKMSNMNGLKTDTMKKMKKEQIEEVIKVSWNRYYGLPEDSDNIRPSENFEKGFKDGAEWRIRSLWHTTSEQPECGRQILVHFMSGNFTSWFAHASIIGEFKIFNAVGWAYIDDLIPEKEGR